MPRLRILTVEDDSGPSAGGLSMRCGLRAMSRWRAGDGDVGLEMAVKREYDLLLLDLVLPKRDGLEILAGSAAAAAHAAGDYPHRPVEMRPDRVQGPARREPDD